MDNLILTPHIGSYAREARQLMEETAISNLCEDCGKRECCKPAGTVPGYETYPEPILRRQRLLRSGMAVTSRTGKGHARLASVIFRF